MNEQILFSDLAENKVIKINDEHFLCKKNENCSKCFFINRSCSFIDCGFDSDRYTFIYIPILDMFSSLKI
jgi:hypothetical protein